MKINRFEDKEAFIKKSVDAIVEICKNKKGRVYIALSGGKTPQPIYMLLGQREDVDFSRIDFFLVDERYVPLTHEDSNYRMMMDKLGRERGVRIHFFDTTLSIDRALSVYADELETVPGGVFDLIILGIGTDGHVASLFPHSEALRAPGNLAITLTERFAVRERMTMTFSIIMKAKQLLLVAGPSKKDVLDEMIYSTKNVQDLPAKKIIENPGLIIHFLEN